MIFVVFNYFFSVHEFTISPCKIFFIYKSSNLTISKAVKNGSHSAVLLLLKLFYTLHYTTYLIFLTCQIWTVDIASGSRRKAFEKRHYRKHVSRNNHPSCRISLRSVIQNSSCITNLFCKALIMLCERLILLRMFH